MGLALEIFSDDSSLENWESDNDLNSLSEDAMAISGLENKTLEKKHRHTTDAVKLFCP